MAIAHVIMGLLASGERHGYRLRDELAGEFGSEWQLDYGQLYRLLGTMRKARWIRARLQPAPQGPRRKVYALTERGRSELERWLAAPDATPRRGRDELPIKLHLGLARHQIPATAGLDERRQRLERRHLTVQDRAETAQRTGDAGQWLLAETQRRQIEGALASLDSCAALIPAANARAAAPATLVAVGSDDLLLNLLADSLAQQQPAIRFSTSPSGSLSGLIALSQGRAHLAGIHLLDVDSGEYNLPFVKHLLPEEPLVLVHLAQREQGLILAPGNPRGIRGIKDLGRRGVTLVNRQRGAGTRLLLHHRLRQARIDPGRITGYDREAPTHNAVAAAIAAGTADVGPGIRAVADAWGLEFIALGHERYDLAVPRKIFESRALQPLLELMHQRTFRQAAARLTGYDVTRMSRVVASTN